MIPRSVGVFAAGQSRILAAAIPPLVTNLTIPAEWAPEHGTNPIVGRVSEA